MAETLVGAIGAILSVQRWNVMPRIDTWTEAENIAYTTHVVYAVGRTLGFAPDVLVHALNRSLLKSLNKHVLSDIAVNTRRALRAVNPGIWKTIIDEVAGATSELFPKDDAKFARDYMTLDGDYTITGDSSGSVKGSIEELVRYAQLKVALEECRTNMVAYPGNAEYGAKSKNIQRRINRLRSRTTLEANYSNLSGYLEHIKNLKYVRRWNTTSRFIDTSVLAHTFIVSFLALYFSRMHRKVIKPRRAGGASYPAILRALFHDVPESLTGDIITPVKTIMERKSKGVVKKLEERMLKDLREAMPRQMKDDVATLNLLSDLGSSNPFSVESLVKDCDRLGIVLECVFELAAGRLDKDMGRVYSGYLEKLQTSEWSGVREFCTQIHLEYPRPI